MNLNKQRAGLFITGTDTDVGKTYIGKQIVALLHDKKINAVPRKPIESGCRREGNDLIPADANDYFMAAQKKYPLNEICPFRFEPAISPQRAARLANQLLYIDEITYACLKNLHDEDYLVVEGAGGFYSPLYEDGKNADLAKKLNLPVLLVANDKLGCINHILLTVEAIKNQGLILKAVILNQNTTFATEEMNNYEDLKKLIDTPIFLIKQNEHIKHNTKLIDSLLQKIL